MEKFKCAVPIQIRMSDLDPLGHVNNGIYCHFYDLGRIHYIENLLGRTDWKTLELVLVHLEVDFQAPILFHDRILCDTRVYAMGGKRLKMEQRLREAESGAIKSVCRSVLSGFDRDTGQSKEIPEEEKRKIIAFEEDDRLLL